MGVLIDLNSPKPITVGDLPLGATLDTELEAANQAHLSAFDPHPGKYQSLLPVTVVQQQVSAPAQISIIADSWFSLGIFSNLNSGSAESLFAMTLFIQYTASGNTYPHWQNSGTCLLSPIWWKDSGAQLVKYIDMESHARIDYVLSFRLGLSGQGSRMVELYFPISLTARLIRAKFIRLSF